MSFNGTGSFVRIYDWSTDRDGGVKILAERMDTEDDGFATGLSLTICRDGQSTTTARIPFNLGVTLPAGTVSAPGWNVSGDSNTGWYAPGADNIAATCGGTNILDVTTTGVAITGTLSVSGTITLAAISGTTGAFSSTLSATGNFAVNTNKFTVTASSGNTAVAGTLSVTGALTYGGVTLTNAVTGTGKMVLDTTPTLVTPILGTPTSGTLTNCTLPVGGISGLAANVATFLAAPSSANLIAAMTDETGTGANVFATSPSLVTPLLGTPTSGTLTNCTGLPVSSGISGLGTGVATALAVNVGSAGAPVTFNGALGTPSSGTVTNLTGTASINVNGTVGATTPAAGTFTAAIANSFVPNLSTVPTNGMYLPAGNTLGWAINSAAEVQLTSTALSPAASDGNALGTTALPWGDVFLASGGVVNFANGDATITHSSGKITFGITAAELELTATALSPAVSDGNALGSTSLMWADAFFASGAVINFNNGDVTVTHSANLLAFAGASSGYTFDVPIGAASGGTGVASPATHTIPINQGSSAQANTGTGTIGQALVSGGASADPAWKSGTWVLIETLTASNSATLTNAVAWDATYNDYMLVFEAIVPATNSVGFEIQVHSGGSFQTTSYLAGANAINQSGTSNARTSTTFIIGSTVGATSNTAAHGGVNGSITVFNPSGTVAPKFWIGDIMVPSSSSAFERLATAGYWNGGTGAVDGFQVLFVSGNITSGVIKVYGRL